VVAGEIDRGNEPRGVLQVVAARSSKVGASPARTKPMVSST
jgi:hypothetical protein